MVPIVRCRHILEKFCAQDLFQVLCKINKKKKLTNCIMIFSVLYQESVVNLIIIKTGFYFILKILQINSWLIYYLANRDLQITVQ